MLLSAQRHHRVNARRASSRNPGGGETDQAEDEGDGNHRHRVERFYPEEELAQ
jgi:hypothetical protein